MPPHEEQTYSYPCRPAAPDGWTAFASEVDFPELRIAGILPAIRRPTTGRAADRWRDLIADRLHQLDPVAERIVDVDPVVSFEGLVVTDRGAGGAQDLDQGGQVVDQERRVGLACRSEVGLDAQVDLEVPALEPAAPARREMGRLGGFVDTEEPRVEGPRLVLVSGWHRQLNMVDPGHPHGIIMPISPDRGPGDAVHIPAKAFRRNCERDSWTPSARTLREPWLDDTPSDDTA